VAETKRHDELQGEIVHEYDGIEEADNALPLWWLAIFYGAIVFGIGYYFFYEGYKVEPVGRAAYDQEMAAQAAAAPEVTAEQLVALGEDDVAVAAGRAVFAANCVACHDQEAQGKIGPNLTDAYWIHGGSAMDIHHTIEQGYSAKGMPAWGASLGADAVNQAVAYVLSIRGTNVEGKEAQGELYAPEGVTTEAQEPSPSGEPVVDAGADASATGEPTADESALAEPATDVEDSTVESAETPTSE